MSQKLLREHVKYAIMSQGTSHLLVNVPQRERFLLPIGIGLISAWFEIAELPHLCLALRNVHYHLVQTTL